MKKRIVNLQSNYMDRWERKNDSPSVPLYSTRVLVVVGAVMALVLSGLQVTIAAKVATMGREIEAMEQEKNNIYQSIGRIKKGIAEQSTISSIEQRALNNLGMRKLDGLSEVVYLEDNSTQPLAVR